MLEVTARAKKKLEKLANGKYHSISYELTTFRTGEERPECTLYIDGGKHHQGRTWESAFDSLQGIKPKRIKEQEPKLHKGATC